MVSRGPRIQGVGSAESRAVLPLFRNSYRQRRRISAEESGKHGDFLSGFSSLGRPALPLRVPFSLSPSVRPRSLAPVFVLFQQGAHQPRELNKIYLVRRSSPRGIPAHSGGQTQEVHPGSPRRNGRRKEGKRDERGSEELLATARNVAMRANCSRTRPSPFVGIFFLNFPRCSVSGRSGAVQPPAAAAAAAAAPAFRR